MNMITVDQETLKRMIAQAVEAEREACAKVCDIKAEVVAITGKSCDPDDLAAAIRARGEASIRENT